MTENEKVVEQLKRIANALESLDDNLRILNLDTELSGIKTKLEDIDITLTNNL